MTTSRFVSTSSEFVETNREVVFRPFPERRSAAAAFFPNAPIHQAQTDAPGLVDGESGGISALGKSGASGIDQNALGTGGDVRQMGVTVKEEIETTFGKTGIVVDVAVGEKKATPFIDHPSVIGLYGEIEQHLIDFALAVATHCNDIGRALVETLRHGLRIQALGQAVARTVVEDVAQKEKHMATLAVVTIENGFQTGQRAVDIGGYEVFHKANGLHPDTGNLCENTKKSAHKAHERHCFQSDGGESEISAGLTK